MSVDKTRFSAGFWQANTFALFVDFLTGDAFSVVAGVHYVTNLSLLRRALAATLAFVPNHADAGWTLGNLGI